MITASIIENGESKKSILIMENEEAQIIYKALEAYVAANKRQKLPKKMLDKFNKDLECF